MYFNFIMTVVMPQCW